MRRRRNERQLANPLSSSSNSTSSTSTCHLEEEEDGLFLFLFPPPPRWKVTGRAANVSKLFSSSPPQRYWTILRRQFGHVLSGGGREEDIRSFPPFAFRMFGPCSAYRGDRSLAHLSRITGGGGGGGAIGLTNKVGGGITHIRIHLRLKEKRNKCT